MGIQPGEERPLIFSFLFVWQSLYLSSTVLHSLQKVVNKTFFVFRKERELCPSTAHIYHHSRALQLGNQQPTQQAHTYTDISLSLPLYITLYNIC